jgi:hypothetical protein
MGTLNQFAKSIFNASAPSKEVVSHGYSFRIVTTKEGCTIFASPVNYQHSGIMTFSLGRDGVSPVTTPRCRGRATDRHRR